VRTHDHLTVDISGVAYGGDGLAREGGKVYFVNKAIPGDVVKIEVLEDKGRYARAKVVEYVAKSELRSDPPCAFFGKCGGCQWQGIDYQSQVEWKLDFVRSSLKRIGEIDNQIISIVESPSVYRYRNRILLKGRWSTSIYAGYFAKESHDLVEIDHCMISDPLFDAVLAHMRSAISSLGKSQARQEIRFKFELQVLKERQSREPRVTIVFMPEFKSDRADLSRLIEFMKKHPSVSWAGFLDQAEQCEWMIWDYEDNQEYLSRPGIFQQVNVPANRLLRSYVFKIVGESGAQNILDGFCGSGNLSLGLSAENRNIVGVEYNQNSIKAANENSKESSRYVVGDASNFFWKCANERQKCDLVLVDPPREGMAKCVEPLLILNPKVIVYVSCDPTTLARDVKKLCAGQYKIKEVRCFDFFPNTFHVETVAILERT
jgi:23S rRNA (uracil1939-C5)-methyltransferase